MVLLLALSQVAGSMVFTMGSSLYSLVINTHMSMPFFSISDGNKLLSRSESTSSITVACWRRGSTWALNWKLKNRRQANKIFFIPIIVDR